MRETFALISDIHGNLEALETVLKEIDAAGVTRIICLGDIVGYGPDFESCVDIVASRCEVVLCGNHDEAVIHGPVDFNPVARDVIHYTRSVMRPGLLGPAGKRSRWNFLKSLARNYQEGNIQFFHGSPRDPVKEYVMRTDVVFAPEKLRDIFQKIESFCFVGHTHQPGVIEEGSSFHFLEPPRIESVYNLGREKALINVGSLGQPRDGDCRASYVIVEGDRVHFRRAAYDFQTTMRKIEMNSHIHKNCAYRLAMGK